MQRVESVPGSGRTQTTGVNRRNLTILAAVLFVVMLGFGMVMPIFPFYIESLGASAVTFLFLLLANTFATVLLATALFTLPNALLRPAVVALTPKVAPERQGVLMGLNNSFNSLGRAIAPIWAGVVFDVHVNYPYLSGAAIMFVGFLVSIRWLRVQDKTPTLAEEPPRTQVPLSWKER